ncbi:MAG: SGNH/GDSL hydrolase family protein [Verrucomicrobia bacterium]|nr:SGNH/GDSL hydrolase family protein [Verrucomicrobiota bacterium]
MFKTATGKRILLAGITVLAALLSGEIACRTVFSSRVPHLKIHRLIESERGKFCRYDSLLGWRGKPDVGSGFEWIDARHHVQQNSHGFRGADHPFERSGDTRVLFLGDSFTWGFGVEDDQVFTSLIEDHPIGGPLEVVNCGVSGYGTDQELLLWQNYAYQWKPDLTVLMLTPFTDPLDNMSSVRYGYPKPVFRRGPDGLLSLTNVPVPGKSEEWETAATVIPGGRHRWLNTMIGSSSLASLGISALSNNETIRKRLERRGIIPPRPEASGYEYFLFGQNEAGTSALWSVTTDLIGMLGKDVRDRGSRLAVVIIPSVIQIDDAMWAGFAARAPEEFAHPDKSTPNRIISNFCAQENIPCLDLADTFAQSAAAGHKDYYPVNGHWTAGGHRLAAQAIGSFVGDIL